MTREEALKLVTTEYDGLNRVDKKYQNDYDIVKAAVEFWPYQIKYASSYLKSNKELGLIAVCEDGLLIGELGYNLLQDRDIILAALKQDGTAIKFISLAGDEGKEYIDLAIKNNPFAIYYIVPSLITVEQIKYCLSLAPELVEYLSLVLEGNLEIIKIMDEYDDNIHLNLVDNELLGSKYWYFLSDYDYNYDDSSFDLPF